MRVISLTAAASRRGHCVAPASQTLVNTTDPKHVAAAFGMKPEGVMFYLADHVDLVRMP
jgi:hypothetical protein